MSYCRFSSDSDVYVFAHVDGGWMCCGCALASGGVTRTDTRPEMVDHLRAHRAAGDRVPWYAAKQLLKEEEEDSIDA